MILYFYDMAGISIKGNESGSQISVAVNFHIILRTFKPKLLIVSYSGDNEPYKDFA